MIGSKHGRTLCTVCNGSQQTVVSSGQYHMNYDTHTRVVFMGVKAVESRDVCRHRYSICQNGGVCAAG